MVKIEGLREKLADVGLFTRHTHSLHVSSSEQQGVGLQAGLLVGAKEGPDIVAEVGGEHTEARALRKGGQCQVDQRVLGSLAADSIPFLDRR